MRIALPPTIDAVAVAGADRHAAIVTLDGLTMGTSWRVLYAAHHVDATQMHAAIVARLDALVAEMSHWAPESLLSRFNRAAVGSWMTLPPDFAAVMAAGLRIADESDGAFDPAIGRLVDVWGFGPPGATAPPDAATIAAVLARSGWRRVKFDAAARRLFQPGGVALDLSGIAKGYAVDALGVLLRARGVRHALVEVGGELTGFGLRPDGEPWWVDLETPPGIDLPPLRIALHGIAVATSGDYRRGGHNLDPRTGSAVANGVVSVSVLGTCAMIADAWATALTVMGPVAGIEAADVRGLAARIVTASGNEILSRPLIAMLAD